MWDSLLEAIFYPGDAMLDDLRRQFSGPLLPLSPPPQRHPSIFTSAESDIERRRRSTEL